MSRDQRIEERFRQRMAEMKPMRDAIDESTRITGEDLAVTINAKDSNTKPAPETASIEEMREAFGRLMVAQDITRRIAPDEWRKLQEVYEVLRTAPALETERDRLQREVERLCGGVSIEQHFAWLRNRNIWLNGERDRLIEENVRLRIELQKMIHPIIEPVELLPVKIGDANK